MAHCRDYAAKRVERLKAKLVRGEASVAFNQELIDTGKSIDADFLQRDRARKIVNSTKTALRRWLRLFPGLDDAFLASITR